MEAILANASQLNAVLLETDEEEYDSLSLQVLSALRKLSTNDPSRVLDVG